MESQRVVKTWLHNFEQSLSENKKHFFVNCLNHVIIVIIQQPSQAKIYEQRGYCLNFYLLHKQKRGKEAKVFHTKNNKTIFGK